jgi:hypothetical protein
MQSSVWMVVAAALARPGASHMLPGLGQAQSIPGPVLSGPGRGAARLALARRNSRAAVRVSRGRGRPPAPPLRAMRGCGGTRSSDADADTAAERRAGALVSRRETQTQGARRVDIPPPAGSGNAVIQ